MKIRQPQNVPRVLQRKTAPAAAPPQTPPRRPAVAPPVYRPQATPRCLQLKKAGVAQPAKPAKPIGPTARLRAGRQAGVVQRMEIKPNPQPDEIKSEITIERNSPFDALPHDTMLNIFGHLDCASGARLGRTQKSLHHFREQKFSATTEWGVFWITDYSYYLGISYEHGKRMGPPPKVPPHQLQKKIGVSIKIEFLAGPKVKADKIGLVQTVQHYVNNIPYSIDSYKSTMWVDAEEGYKTHIDVLKEAVDPMYVANINDKTKAKVGSGPSNPFHGQWGTPQQNATLIDEPQDRGVVGSPESTKNTPNSGQVFETTALALAGEQDGQYYGSVKWGWKTDAHGNFHILPLTVISRGSASPTFANAADAWNKGNNTAYRSNRQLPLPK